MRFSPEVEQRVSIEIPATVKLGPCQHPIEHRLLKCHCRTAVWQLQTHDFLISRQDRQ